jgi:predicted transcriptional regulator
MGLVTTASHMPTKKPKLSVYLPDDLKEAVSRLSESRNRSVNNLIETVLREEIKRAIASGEISKADEVKS